MNKLNPLKILLAWIVLVLILGPLLVYTSSIGSSGGDQKPLTTFALILILTIFGAVFICFVTPFIFRSWLKSNRWFIGLGIFLLLPSSAFIWQYYFADPFSYVEEFDEVNGDKWKIKTEYYDNNNEVVRSKSYWKNDKRDSTWIIYSKDGNVASEKVYRNGNLLSEP